MTSRNTRQQVEGLFPLKCTTIRKYEKKENGKRSQQNPWNQNYARSGQEWQPDSPMSYVNTTFEELKEKLNGRKRGQNHFNPCFSPSNHRNSSAAAALPPAVSTYHSSILYVLTSNSAFRCSCIAESSRAVASSASSSSVRSSMRRNSAFRDSSIDRRSSSSARVACSFCWALDACDNDKC